MCPGIQRRDIGKRGKWNPLESQRLGLAVLCFLLTWVRIASKFWEFDVAFDQSKDQQYGAEQRQTRVNIETVAENWNCHVVFFQPGDGLRNSLVLDSDESSTFEIDDRKGPIHPIGELCLSLSTVSGC